MHAYLGNNEQSLLGAAAIILHSRVYKSKCNTRRKKLEFTAWIMQVWLIPSSSLYPVRSLVLNWWMLLVVFSYKVQPKIDIKNFSSPKNFMQNCVIKIGEIILVYGMIRSWEYLNHLFGNKILDLRFVNQTSRAPHHKGHGYLTCFFVRVPASNRNMVSQRTAAMPHSNNTKLIDSMKQEKLLTESQLHQQYLDGIEADAPTLPGQPNAYISNAHSAFHK